MKIAFAAPLLALALFGCAGLGGVAPPAQPTPASIESTVSGLAAISADPVTAWAAADYGVRAACDAYLDAEARRSANLGLAQTGVGTAGLAAAGFAAGAGNPVAAALASSSATLVATFLGEFQSAGALPYSAETSAIIDNAMSAYEAAAPAPTSVAQAALLAEGLWRLCSPVGYAELVAKSISTAEVTAASPPASTPTAAMLPRVGKPRILVNGR